MSSACLSSFCTVDEGRLLFCFFKSSTRHGYSKVGIFYGAFCAYYIVECQGTGSPTVPSVAVLDCLKNVFTSICVMEFCVKVVIL